MNRALRQCGWKNCPAPVRRQVLGLVAAMRKTLGHNLIGIYLHGSLAMGCFNPRVSDIDLLVVTRRHVGAIKRELAALLLAASLKPCPIELSMLARGDLRPWRFPTPFDFHFSEDWRPAYEAGIAFNSMPETDDDLAAHVKVTRRRGMRLFGEPIAKVLPPVPSKDYLNSIASDLSRARRKLSASPTAEKRMLAATYLVLNASRALAFVRTDQVLSKAEGAAWALANAPGKYAPAIRGALREYRSGFKHTDVDIRLVRSFAAYVRGAIMRRGAAHSTSSSASH